MCFGKGIQPSYPQMSWFCLGCFSSPKRMHSSCVFQVPSESHSQMRCGFGLYQISGRPVPAYISDRLTCSLMMTVGCFCCNCGVPFMGLDRVEDRWLCPEHTGAAKLGQGVYLQVFFQQPQVNSYIVLVDFHQLSIFMKEFLLTFIIH